MQDSWHRLAEEIGRVRDLGRGAEDLWARFRRLADSEPRYGNLAATADALPIRMRLLVARVASLLAEETVWPHGWRRPREELVAGLDALLRETDRSRGHTLAGLLVRNGDIDPHWLGTQMLAIGREFLARPCPVSELALVGAVCSLGLSACLRVYRQALKVPAPADPGALMDARVTFLHAFNRYADAAREMNSLAGRALFTHLDAPLS